MSGLSKPGVHTLCKIRAVNAASETTIATLIRPSRIVDREDPFDGLAAHRARLAYNASCILRAKAVMAARDGRHGRRPLEADDARRLWTDAHSSVQRQQIVV